MENNIKFFQFVINNLEKNLLYLYRNINYHQSYLHQIIRDDNVIEFQSYFSYNYTFPFSHYERVKSVDKEITLIKCAAIYGSINI